jgi:hypothetical protein
MMKTSIGLMPLTRNKTSSQDHHHWVHGASATTIMQFTGYSELVKSAHQRKTAYSNTNTKVSRGDDSSDCYTDGDDDDVSSLIEYEVGLESDEINSDKDDDRYR